MDDYLYKIHSEELRMMKSISEVCEKLNVTYIICAGTLLGAVRHSGFIPWDDDIDIAMPREDYEVFLKKASALLPPHLFVQHYSTEPNTNALWTKVRNTNTLFIEADNEKFAINHGIFIDVFPFDRSKRGYLAEKIEFFKKLFFNVSTGCYSNSYINSIQSPVKRFLGRCIKKYICKRIPISEYIEREDCRRQKMNNEGVDCYPVHFFENKGALTYDELFRRKKYKFEDQEFYGPEKHNLLLEKMYGNYMEIPPKEKQITHKPLKVVFDLEKENVYE